MKICFVNSLKPMLVGGRANFNFLSALAKEWAFPIIFLGLLLSQSPTEMQPMSRRALTSPDKGIARIDLVRVQIWAHYKVSA